MAHELTIYLRDPEGGKEWCDQADVEWHDWGISISWARFERSWIPWANIARIDRFASPKDS